MQTTFDGNSTYEWEPLPKDLRLCSSESRPPPQAQHRPQPAEASHHHGPSRRLRHRGHDRGGERNRVVPGSGRIGVAVNQNFRDVCVGRQILMIGEKISLTDQEVQVRYRQDTVLINVCLGKRRADCILISECIELEIINGCSKSEVNCPGAINTGSAGTDKVRRRALVFRLRSYQDLFSACRRKSNALRGILVCDGSARGEIVKVDSVGADGCG